jgi:hypothetical protein
LYFRSRDKKVVVSLCRFRAPLQQGQQQEVVAVVHPTPLQVSQAVVCRAMLGGRVVVALFPD